MHHIYLDNLKIFSVFHKQINQKLKVVLMLSDDRGLRKYPIIRRMSQRFAIIGKKPEKGGHNFSLHRKGGPETF